MTAPALKRLAWWMLPVCSAVLLGAAYPASPAPVLAFVALIPLFLFLDRATASQAFFGGWIFGFLFIGWVLRWFFDVVALDWAGVSHPFFGYALGVIFWLVVTGTLSVFFGVFGRAYRLCLSPWKPVCVPCAWIVLEYVRSFALGLVLAGSETLFGSHWTFGTLGYIFSEFPLLLPTAKLFGLYGASFVLVWCNYVLARALSAPAYFFREGLAGVLGLVALAGYGLYALSLPGGSALTRSVALVQTQSRMNLASTPYDTERVLAIERTLTAQAAGLKTDLLVLPETSHAIAVQRNPFAYLNEMLADSPSTTALFSKKSNHGRSFLDVFWYRPDTGILAKTQKTLLIPGGEYVPFLFEIPLRLFGAGEFLDFFNANFAAFRGEDSLINTSGREVPTEGVLLCSAVFAPDAWRGLALRGAEIFINPANQSFFTSTSFHAQNRRMLQFFAAANDRWFLQTSNGGRAYVIDHNGAILKELPVGNAVLEYRAEYRTTMPLAVRFGNWPIALAVGALGYCMVKRKSGILHSYL